MSIYYLIEGNRITQEIDAEISVTALPLLSGNKSRSLINRAHIIALMNKFNRTNEQIIDDLGLVDERE